jgi:rhodanese-related sulfurtransferase
MFSKSFIPGSLSISLDGQFASTVGNVLNPDSSLIIISETGMEAETILRLARVGYENVTGFLNGGFEAWKNSGNETDTLNTISAEEFALVFSYNTSIVLDVRNPDEWVPGFVAGAKLISLPGLEQNIPSLDPSKTYYVYCAGGYRSMVAVSMLKKYGFNNVFNVLGGMNKIRKSEISIKQLTSLAS